MNNYVEIVAPLITFLKNNSFVWNDIIEQAFFFLKQAMWTTPFLAIPNFTKTFVLECDYSRKGMGVVLMQE